MQTGRFTFVLAIAFGAMACIPSAHAQQTQQPAQADSGSQATPGQDAQNPLTRQLSDKERFKQQRDLKQELHGTYKTWLDVDVRWIITDQERKAFKSLSNDEERDAFIEQFWQRRNPDPDSPENTFREEHYRRIAYANEHFAAGKPGWMTDRGHIYIA
ncbi:MAG: GWxTD domain-containing protein, partial [Silvibacterium sp.]